MFSSTFIAIMAPIILLTMIIVIHKVVRNFRTVGFTIFSIIDLLCFGGCIVLLCRLGGLL
jgi:hypothetical protein